MSSYDVVVIGGGINGLTVAAYLAKSGVSVGVFEARGQCGAHCDTVEFGIPGFLHNPHAQWLVPAMGPPMADLDLEGFGLELRGTDVLYAKTFLSGTNVLQATDPALTQASVERISEHDWAVQKALGDYMMQYAIEHTDEFLDLQRRLNFGAAQPELFERQVEYHDGLLASLGLGIRGADIRRMSGFDLMDVLLESDEVRTTRISQAEYTGRWPHHPGTAALLLGQSSGGSLAVHTARGGSHALTHALVKCVVAHGGDIWTTCPVEKILVEDGRARGIRLSEDALWPGEEIEAGLVISNLTLVPTFLRLLGEEVIGSEWADRIRRFDYDEPQLAGIYYALDGDVEFATADYDPGVQRCWVGYFGGETYAEVKAAFADLAQGVMPDDIMAGWFIPTRADPTQAPPGCHTVMAWVSVPPCPTRWRGRALSGWDAWPEIAEPLGDAVTERFEEYAPGFSDRVLERFVMTPLDQERNNPSAIRGNMIGGSAIPDQVEERRPLPGIIESGASRTFIPGLYLSNSIHPYGASHLASGYVTACDVADDLGCREQAWWTSQPIEWFLENQARIPVNLGVGAKWKPDAEAVPES